MGSMALQLRPFQAPDPTDWYKQAVTLRELVDQRRYRQLQAQHLERQMAKEEQDRADLETFQREYAKLPENATLRDIVTLPGGLKYGPTVYTQERQARTAATQAKTAELTQQQKERELAKANLQDMIGDMQYLGTLQPEQQAAMYPQIRDKWVKRGVRVPDAVPSPEELKGYMAQAYTLQEQLDIQSKQQSITTGKAAETRAAEAAARAQQTQQAQLPGIQAESLSKQWATAAQTVPDDPDQWNTWLADQPEAIKKNLPELYSKGAVEFIRNKGLTAQQRATGERQAMPNTASELAIIAADQNQPPEKRKAASDALKVLERHAILSRPQVNVTVPSYGSLASTLTGEEFLKTMKPGQAALVRAIAEGRESLSGRSSKDVLALKAAVQQYDPGYSEQRAQIRKAFTTGKEGQNIGALNTAMVHLGRLSDAAEEMKNGTFTPANEMFNYLKDKFGAPAITNFALLKDAVAGEMAAALKGNATDIEIANMKNSIRASNSHAQMQGVIKEGIGILSDKANTYDERYHRESPSDTNWSPILPSARATMQRFGVPARGQQGQATGMVKMQAPNGQTKDVPADQVKYYESKGAKRVQ